MLPPVAITLTLLAALTLVAVVPPVGYNPGCCDCGTPG